MALTVSFLSCAALVAESSSISTLLSDCGRIGALRLGEDVTPGQTRADEANLSADGPKNLDSGDE